MSRLETADKWSLWRRVVWWKGSEANNVGEPLIKTTDWDQRNPENYATTYICLYFKSDHENYLSNNIFPASQLTISLTFYLIFFQSAVSSQKWGNDDCKDSSFLWMGLICFGNLPKGKKKNYKETLQSSPATKVGHVAKLLFIEICKIFIFLNCGASSALTVCVGAHLCTELNTLWVKGEYRSWSFNWKTL